MSKTTDALILLAIGVLSPACNLRCDLPFAEGEIDSDVTTEVSTTSIGESTAVPTSASSGETIESSDTGSSGETDLCGPLDWSEFAERPAIYVSSAGDDDNPGSPDQPKETLQAALNALGGESSVVFVCDEPASDDFVLGNNDNDEIVVPPNVSIIGGMACFDKWAFPTGAERMSRIATQTGLGLRIQANSDLEHRRVLANLVIDVKAPIPSSTTASYGQPDELRHGGSAIGLLIEGGRLDLIHVSISAGDASDGLSGDSHCDELPLAGESGKDGVPSGCQTFDNQFPCHYHPEACAPQLCPNAQPRYLGGEGGLGGEPGEIYELGEEGQGPTGGAAGMSPFNEGKDGGSGSQGRAGSWVPKPALAGSIGILGYLPAGGGDGWHGGNGSGGGGCRGNQGAETGPDCGFTSMYRAASGGSGGSGGCGGHGGVGGGGGGSSIGVIALDSVVNLIHTHIDVGHGGRGGDAGCRQLGAPGGAGGEPVEEGCGGGNGGAGGAGGLAGSGSGGHSIGIAMQSATVVFACDDQELAISLGEAGDAGDPEASVIGTMLESGLRGPSGLARDVQDFALARRTAPSSD